MSLVVQVAVTGLAAGAGYGLVAMAFALVYQLTGVLHLALGQLGSVAVFTTLAVMAGTGLLVSPAVPQWRLGLAVMAGLAASTVAGAAVYAIAIRPFLRRASVVGWIGGVVAATFAIRGTLQALLSRPGYGVPDLFSFDPSLHRGLLTVAGATVEVRSFFVLASGALLTIGLTLFLRRTRPGHGLRAAASDPLAARLSGVPVERLLLAAFALAGLLAGLGALLAVAGGPAVTADTTELIGLKALAAALVAGFGAPGRAFGAGLAVGVLEATAANLHVGPVSLGPGWGDLLPLIVALVVIAVRPMSLRAGEPV